MLLRLLLKSAQRHARQRSPKLSCHCLPLALSDNLRPLEHIRIHQMLCPGSRGGRCRPITAPSANTCVPGFSDIVAVNDVSPYFAAGRCVPVLITVSPYSDCMSPSLCRSVSPYSGLIVCPRTLVACNICPADSRWNGREQNNCGCRNLTDRQLKRNQYLLLSPPRQLNGGPSLDHL